MRNWILVSVMLAFMMGGHSIAQTNDGQPTVCTLKVAGMTCGGCESAGERAAKHVDRVKSVQLFPSGLASMRRARHRVSPDMNVVDKVRA